MNTDPSLAPRWMERYPDHFKRVGNVSPHTGAQAGLEDEKAEAWLPAGRGARILDIGCGWANRLVAMHAAGYSDLTGLDASEEMIQRAREHAPEGIRLIRADALGFLRESVEFFDRVLLFDVLEHLTVDEAVQVLEACRNRLTTDGLVVVQVPNLACLTAVHMFFSDVTHKQGYTEFSLAQVFDVAGLRTELVCPTPKFRLSRWRPWRPLHGTTLAWRASRVLHRLLYWITNVGPKARCYCPTLLMLGRL